MALVDIRPQHDHTGDAGGPGAGGGTRIAGCRDQVDVALLRVVFLSIAVIAGIGTFIATTVPKPKF